MPDEPKSENSCDDCELEEAEAEFQPFHEHLMIDIETAGLNLRHLCRKFWDERDIAEVDVVADAEQTLQDLYKRYTPKQYLQHLCVSHSKTFEQVSTIFCDSTAVRFSGLKKYCLHNYSELENEINNVESKDEIM